MSYSTSCRVIWRGYKHCMSRLAMREGADLVLKLVVMRIDCNAESCICMSLLGSYSRSAPSSYTRQWCDWSGGNLWVIARAPDESGLEPLAKFYNLFGPC